MDVPKHNRGMFFFLRFLFWFVSQLDIAQSMTILLGYCKEAQPEPLQVHKASCPAASHQSQLTATLFSPPSKVTAEMALQSSWDLELAQSWAAFGKGYCCCKRGCWVIKRM